MKRTGGIKMTHVTFAEYQAAKNEIIGGVKYEEETQFPNQWGMSSKQYHTVENGTFYEVRDPNTGIIEFWSDKHADSRYYDSRSKDEIIAQLEAKLAAAEQEKETAYRKGAQAAVRKYPATEYKGRVFKIFNEIKDPYENQKSAGEIELSEGVYMGGDLYIVPMQVFKTDNPALLKVVFMVAGGCNTLPSCTALQSDFAEITDNNIRTALMTKDRKLYYHSGAIDCEGIYDLTPQPQRLEE
jgi:hypothetical protein